MDEIRCDNCKQAAYQCEPCTREQLSYCSCGSGQKKYGLYDCHNIFCAYVCDECEAQVKQRYRPEVFTDYTQADVDEPIEPEEW